MLNKILSALAYCLLNTSLYFEVIIAVNRLIVTYRIMKMDIIQDFNLSMARKFGLGALLEIFLLLCFIFTGKVEMLFTLTEYSFSLKFDNEYWLARLTAKLISYFIMMGVILMIFLYLAIGVLVIVSKFKVNIYEIT